MVGVNVRSENCPEPLPAEQKSVKIPKSLKDDIYDKSNSMSLHQIKNPCSFLTINQTLFIQVEFDLMRFLVQIPRD